MTENASEDTTITLESIVESLLQQLRGVGALRANHESIPWDSFLRLSNLIHESYNVPYTTFTPIMRRLLFGLGHSIRPSNIVGAGTFVGYTFSWLLNSCRDAEVGPFFDLAIGFDVDCDANAVARRNCAVLGHGERLLFKDCDAIVGIANISFPISMLYIDIDSSETGKAAYTSVLEASVPHLETGSFILAHDACVPKFESDFALYHQFIRESQLFLGAWVFPVDSCGLSVAVLK